MKPLRNSNYLSISNNRCSNFRGFLYVQYSYSLRTEKLTLPHSYLSCLISPGLYGSLSKNGGIVVLFNFLAYVPSIFLFLCLQHLATLWVTKTEHYVWCPMTLFENST